MFDGARADLTKALSLNPTFSVTHSFALGSQNQDPTYSFNAAFMSPKVGVLKV
jgi:mitochondrial import receptor subunit TOM40